VDGKGGREGWECDWECEDLIAWVRHALYYRKVPPCA